MKKRILSAVLALLTIAGFVPASVLAASAGTDTSGSSSFLEKMEQQSLTEPDGFGADEGYATPYGTKKGQTFTIQEHSELFQYHSYDLNDSSKATSVAKLYNQTYTTASSGDKVYSLYKESDITDYNNYNYVQAVSCDPTGCGRRNYIAFVGYNKSDKDIYVWFMNAETQKKVGNAVKVADADWITYNNNHLDLVHARNFFQITAGDYDGDGKDTVVVYAGANQGAKLTAVTLNGTTATAKSLSGYEHKSYSNSKGSYQTRNIMGMSLYSGDVNGDGIDDLAALAYVNNINSGTYSDVSLTAYAPQLTVALGRDGADIQDLYKQYTTVGSFKNGQYTTMAAPGVAIGDIDGDGYNEIVTAGFLNYASYSKKINLQDGKVAFAAYNCDTGVVSLNGNIVILEGDDVSAISKGDSLRRNDSYLWQQFAVECVQYGGINTKELVFLNGYSYYLNDDGTLDLRDNQNGMESYFKTLFKDVAGTDVNENFIYSMAVGDFFNSSVGNESIVVIVGYKTNKKNGSGTYDYYFEKINVYYHDNYSVSYVPYLSNRWVEDVPVVFKRGDALDQVLNCIVCAVDYDYDSIIGRYSDKKFAYTDPEVIAVLQAAPYFEELGAENSSTEFSYSESYEKGTGSGTEKSFEIGLATEATVGPLKVAVDAGYSMQLSEEYTSSRSWTYGTTFKANDQNQIILRRTLMYFYCYDILDSSCKNSKTGKYEWKTSELVVAVPQYPVMSSLNVSQYNEFATAYNAKYTGSGISAGDSKYNSALNKSYKLDIISDKDIAKYYLNNEGNPYNYGKNYTDYGSNAFKVGHSQDWIELSHSGGTTEQFLQVDSSSSYTKVRSDGGYVNMSVMVGGDYLFGEAWGGVSTSVERLSSSITTETKVTTQGSGGEIQNLSEDLIDYKFNWMLVGWTTGSGEFFQGVPFIGYAVKGVSSPTNPVTDLSGEYSLDGTAETVSLSWTAPTVTKGRAAIAKFNVYRLTDSGETLLGEVANTGVGNTHTLTVDVSEYGTKSAVFVVRSVDAKKNESIDSNEVNCQFNLSVREVQEMINSVTDDLSASAESIKKLIASGDAASSNELKEEVDKLNKAIASAQTAAQTYADSMDAQLKKELEQSVADAREILQKAIDALTERVTAAENAIKGLQSDKATKEELDAAAKDLSDAIAALEAVKDAYKGADDALENKLNKVIADAETTLKGLIGNVQTNLDKAIDELNKAISDGDSDLGDRIDDLAAALKAAKAALEKADTDNKAALEQAVADAEKTLQSALDKAIDELNKAISDGDSDLGDRIDDLTAALEAAKAALEKADTDNKAALEQAVADAEKALQSALDKAIDELNKAISDGDSDLSDRIDDLTAALEAAKAALDKADADNKAALEQAVTDAEKALQEAVNKAASDLESARADLEAAISSGNKDLDDKITALGEALSNADSALAAADKANKAELEGKLATAQTTLQSAVSAVKNELDEAKTTLDKAIADGKDNLESEITGLTSALETARAALEAADLANKSELSELRVAIADAQTALQAAIDKVADDLADVKTALDAKDAELAAKDAELEAKDAEQQTFITVVCAMTCVALAGNIATAAVLFKLKRKRK